MVTSHTIKSSKQTDEMIFHGKSNKNSVIDAQFSPELWATYIYDISECDLSG